MPEQQYLTDAATKRAEMRLRDALVAVWRGSPGIDPGVNLAELTPYERQVYSRTARATPEWMKPFGMFAEECFDVRAEARMAQPGAEFGRILDEIVTEVLALISGPDGLWPRIMEETRAAAGFFADGFAEKAQLVFADPTREYIPNVLADRVREWEARHLEQLAAHPGPKAPTEVSREGDGTGALTWKHVSIMFISDERIQIRTGSDSETLNFAEFGLSDQRSGKPNLAWFLLRSLAENEGVIRTEHDAKSRKWATVEKSAQALRKALRARFGLRLDPIPLVKGVGYQARFKIGCAPSFNA